MLQKLLVAGAACWNRIRDTDAHRQCSALRSVFSTAVVSALRARVASVWTESRCAYPSTGRRFALGVTMMTLLSVVAVEPALAQSNPVCTDDSGRLVNMIEGFVQVTTGLGVMGLLVVWQADSLMEMFALGQKQRDSLKQHKQTALKSAVVLVLLGPLFTLMGSSMDLPIADCVDLIPF